MRLLLTLEPAGGAPRDVAAELEPDVGLDRLVAALADAVDLPAGANAGCVRTGAPLEGAGPAGDAGLLDGDRIVLAAATEATTVIRTAAAHGAAVDLVVVGGPLMGTRIGLAAGEHVVGRGPGADVTLADRSLSRRHLQVAVADGSVSVTDLGSSNGTYVQGVALAGAHAVGDGDTVEAGRSLLAFRPAGDAAGAGRDPAAGRTFNRPPRVAVPVPSGTHDVPSPPAAPTHPPLSIGAALIPLVLAGAMFAVTRSPAVLMIGALTPLMAAWSHVENRRRSARARRDDRARFDGEFEQAVAAVERARADEGAALRRRHPDAAELLRRAAELDPALWQRRPGDDDFLELRLGVGDGPSGVETRLQAGGAAADRRAAEERLAASATLPAVPVAAPAAGLGLVGAPHRTAALGRWLLAQAAVHHSPAELSIALAVRAEAVPEWEWVKWLPHLGRDQVAVGNGQARALLERLAATGSPHQLLLVDGELALDRALVAEVYRAGTAVLWLGRAVEDLPGEVTTIAETEEEVARMRVTDVAAGTTLAGVTADGVQRDWAEDVARALAPVRDAAARGRDSVPAQVPLLELLGMGDASPAAIADAWRAPADGLAAPIGRTADGTFSIDPARTDGLRGLIAGMPGAGKSELLQSIVASLAARHSPRRLGFLLVDYKGGAAFGDCAELPHTAGLITDLDAQLAERARISLLAELRRREALLAEAGARSLGDLALRRPDRAPPALLIVVDEFATLVREVPAFVETMIDVAQRGRSLGLHVILATQRPRGAVSDTMRANTNLRIAMRAADAAESQDVIEAPDAAAIPAALPGRAIAMGERGPDGRPALVPFQSAFPSGRSRASAGGTVRVVEHTLGGTPGEAARQLSVIGTPGPTDLQAIVAGARAAAERLGIERPAPPWLPPLPALVDLASLPDGGAAGAAVLGLCDEPERRAQVPFAFDLDADGSLLVFGASGSGKTTLLRSLAVALARRHGPEDLHLYALDHASRGLRALEALPQCGAVIASGEQERTQRLLDRLGRLAEERRRLLGEHRAASVAELRARGVAGPRVPRVVVLLDGYPAFASAFERVRFGQDLAAFQQLAAEGRALGIHVVATADRRAGVPGGLAGVVPKRVVLRMADDDDYAALGIPRSAAAGADLPPGRGFTGEGTPVQIALLGGAPEAEQAAIDALAREARAAFPGHVAPPVGTLPAHVARAELPAPGGPLAAILGIGADALGAVGPDLGADHFLIAGPLRSGRSTALLTAAASLLAGTPGAELHLLAPRRSPLAGALPWTSVAEGMDACRTAADGLLALLDRPAGAPPAIVVVDDGGELGEPAALETLVRRGRDAGVRVLAAVETAAAQRAYGGWLRELRNGRRALLLQADPETDGELVGVKLPRGGGPLLRPGLGYLVAPGSAELVQVGG